MHRTALRSETGISFLLFLACVVAFGVALSFTPARAVQFNASELHHAAQLRFGERGAAKMSEWMAGLSRQRTLPAMRQLRVVNDFWNSAAVGDEDIHIWGVVDYWATPLETLGKGAADCEDYVIGKYFSLLHLGVPAEKLRMIYVRARLNGKSGPHTIAHMVLGYYETPESEPLLLDSLTSSISPASKRRDLTPVFSFNAEGVYVAGQARSVQGVGRWQDLVSRMRQEGFEFS